MTMVQMSQSLGKSSLLLVYSDGAETLGSDKYLDVSWQFGTKNSSLKKWLRVV